MKAYRGNTAQNTEKKYQTLYFFRGRLRKWGFDPVSQKKQNQSFSCPQLAQVFLPTLLFSVPPGMKPTLQHRERHPEVCSMIAYRVSETPTKSWWAVRGYILKWVGSDFLKHQQYY